MLETTSSGAPRSRVGACLHDGMSSAMYSTSETMCVERTTILSWRSSRSSGFGSGRAFGVEPCGGLVENEPRGVDDRLGDAEAASCRPRTRILARHVGEPDLVEQFEAARAPVS